jgi:hypothetical protein
MCRLDKHQKSPSQGASVPVSLLLVRRAVATGPVRDTLDGKPCSIAPRKRSTGMPRSRQTLLCPLFVAITNGLSTGVLLD